MFHDVLVGAAAIRNTIDKGLKQQTFIPHLLDAGMSEIKALTDLESGGSLLLGLQTATFSLFPHMVESTKEKNPVSPTLFIRALMPLMMNVPS